MTSDVVYVVRPGDDNEELRYSLRTLRNLPHGKVWIAGYCPTWVSEDVRRIPVAKQRDRNVSAKANLRAACEHPEVSEQFVYMNDDFFVMQPLDHLPVMHRGPVAALVTSGIMASAYTRAMKNTLALLQDRGIDEPLMYDLHAPMLVDKAGMLTALDLCHIPAVQERTLYGNLKGIGGELRHNHKVRRAQKGWESWAFLSTEETTFRTRPVGQHIRAAFGDPSSYETDTPLAQDGVPPLGYRGTPHGHPPPPLRRPVRYHAVGGQVRAVAMRPGTIPQVTA
jgi:hypothetical protein